MTTECIALLRIDKCLVGFAGLKRPRFSYRTEVQKGSGLALSQEVYPFGLGWVFIRRETLPYTTDAWIKEAATKIGYEGSFTRHFYKPQSLRTLEEISSDVLAVEQEAKGLLAGIIGGEKT